MQLRLCWWEQARTKALLHGAEIQLAVSAVEARDETTEACLAGYLKTLKIYKLVP